MSGIEPSASAAARAAADAAGKALRTGALETAALLEEAKGSPELQHAAKQRAHRLAVRETLMNKLFAPLARLVNMKADYFEGDAFAEDMARKTSNLPEDEIVAPKPSVAAQAMQGLGFSLDEPDLKEMYLSLLATASTRSRAIHAHPAFAEIIRQLTAEEAAALPAVLRPVYQSICRIHRTVPGQDGNVVVFNHYVNRGDLGLTGVDPKTVAAWVDNWIRLGLVEAAYDRRLSVETAYDWMEEDSLFEALKANRISGPAGVSDAAKPYTWGFDPGFLTVTSFGSQFREAVMSFETPTSSRDAPEPA